MEKGASEDTQSIERREHRQRESLGRGIRTRDIVQPFGISTEPGVLSGGRETTGV